jgi:hypothetical protein
MIELEGDDVLLLRQKKGGPWLALTRHIPGRFKSWEYYVSAIDDQWPNSNYLAGPYGDLDAAHSKFCKEIDGIGLTTAR